MIAIYLNGPGIDNKLRQTVSETAACKATDQPIESVGLFLASFAGMKGISGTPGTVDDKGKSLEKQKIAVS
jgi:hypothetical protein